MRRILHAIVPGLALLLASCATGGPANPALELPAHAKADARIAPLSFLAGKWVCVNPNKTINEEHWMSPRGQFLIGTFRQVRLDGKCAFVEVSQVAIHEDKVVLRLRHMHRDLDVPEKRKDVSLFELQSLTDSRVEFRGTGDAEGVSAVVYERTGPNELRQSIVFDPAKTKQPPFVSVYRRVAD